MPAELPTPDVCAVCLTAPSMLGVLDSCAHVFCVPCVARWATIETKCPLCKARFTCATPTTVDEKGVRSQTGDVIKFEETNQGERARGGDDDDDFEDEYDDMANVMCEVCHRGDDDVHEPLVIRSVAADGQLLQQFLGCSGRDQRSCVECERQRWNAGHQLHHRRPDGWPRRFSRHQPDESDR